MLLEGKEDVTDSVEQSAYAHLLSVVIKQVLLNTEHSKNTITKCFFPPHYDFRTI